jgi:hypothetical protein
MAVLGLVLVALWVAWWAKSVRQDRLAYGRAAWTPILPTLAGDFRVHIDHTARIVAGGGDPYRKDDWVCALLPYPPMIPRLFVWVAPISTDAAVAAWTAALALIVAGSAWAVARSRRALGLTPVPLPWVLVATLYATPTVVAMERGQCDPLVLPLVILAAWLLGRPSRPGPSDALAGSVLGLAAWIKFYPGLVVLGLLGLRRWRAVAAFVVVAGIIGVIDLDGARQAIANGRTLAGMDPPGVAHVHPVQHAIAKFWPHLWAGTSLRGLARLPGPVVAALLLGPPILLVGRRVLRLDRARSAPLALPLLLWIVAAATFALPYSNDYNLVALPLAILACWDRRDGVAVAMVMGLLTLWWQPLALPIDGRVLFVAKLLALYASAACLIHRAREAATPPIPLAGMHRAIEEQRSADSSDSRRWIRSRS